MNRFPLHAVAGSVRLTLVIGLIAMPVAVFSADLHFVRQGGRILSVQTGSMQPLFRPGDAVIAWRVTPDSLQVGDIVSYRSLHDPRVIISHRLVGKNQTTGRLVTKGDALEINDPPVSPEAIIGRVTAVAPNLGRLLAWLRSPLGLGVTVYLPGISIILVQVTRLLRYHRQAGYRLYGR